MLSVCMAVARTAVIAAMSGQLPKIIAIRIRHRFTFVDTLAATVWARRDLVEMNSDKKGYNGNCSHVRSLLLWLEGSLRPRLYVP